MLSIENKINDVFNPIINEFYDLKNDSLEENNLINSKHSIKYTIVINEFISKLSKRFYEIKKSTNDFLTIVKFE
jgi:hypothetical protein